MVDAEREAQLAQRVRAKALQKDLRSEVDRLEAVLKEVLDAKRRVELKAKQAQEDSGGSGGDGEIATAGLWC